MPRKSPATAPSGTKITTADIEAAQRAQAVTAALRRQQAKVAPPPMTAEQERMVRLFDRLERRPTPDELASQQAQARIEDVARRNADGDAARREHAARLRASGYAGWTGGDR